jgi:threonyl-tRNA synthetase
MAKENMVRYEDSNLYRIRHSSAHVMAQAVIEMFPDGKVAIGPPIEDGFITILIYLARSLQKTWMF